MHELFTSFLRTRHLPTTQCWKAWQHVYLVAVFHEFCQVQQCLSDLCNVLRSQGQFNASDQLILLVFIQFRPTWNESSIEEISEERKKKKKKKDYLWEKEYLTASKDSYKQHICIHLWNTAVSFY